MRGRKNKPLPGKATKAPAPPRELSAEARREWRRVASDLAARGLLSGIDRAALAAYCQSYGRWITAEIALAKMDSLDPVTSGLLIKAKNGTAIPNPLIGIANTAASAMVRFAAEFGMTPSARARVASDVAGVGAQGKKEQAVVAASTAGIGTDWGDDLTPSARIN
jgi:P27 family predicted phage terminase small subunit